MNRHNIAPWAVLIAFGVLCGGCAASSFLGYRINPDYPRSKSADVALEGLEHPVEVYLDDYGIPHIEASSERDLMRVVGYMQARNRFFAMDAMRRLATGRLSELVGERPLYDSTTVEFDQAMRGWGFEGLAEQDAERLDPEVLELFEAFVEGINAALDNHVPLEYRLLRVSPEPWRLADTFALGRLNAWTVTHNWQHELARLLLALHGGLARAQRVHPQEPWEGLTSLPAEGPARPLEQAVAPELESLFPLAANEGLATEARTSPGRARAAVALTAGGASNAWVVSGERSASGRPLLANDPHLLHMLPSLLYQQSMRAPGIEVIGAGMAGLPYVLAGHNGKVAWGMTSAVADAQDLVVERPEGERRVRTPEGSAQIEHDEHIIRVRDGGKFREVAATFRRTPHGPLLNDIYPELLPQGSPLVAVRSAAACGARSILALREAARAKDVFELRAALLGMESPPQVWQAIDLEGNIALFLTGALPRRRGYRGTFPVPGWSADYGWDGLVAPEDLPFVVSQTGFLAHANNLIVDPGHGEVFIGVDSAPSYRQERIMALLESRERHSADEMREMQLDLKVERARRLAPLMVASLSDPEGGRELTAHEQRAVALLDEWDYEATVDSAAAAIFFKLYRRAILLALEGELEGPALSFLLGQRYFTNAADLWFDEEDHPVWDDPRTPARETRGTVLRVALAEALAGLTDLQGERPEDFRWGALHDLQLRHLFGGQRAIAGYVNLPPMEVGGGIDSIWKTHFDLGNPAHPFRAVAGPVMRMVVDAADFDAGGYVLETGSSGWPGSPHYGDQHELWKEGRLVPMSLDAAAVRESAKARLEFVPRTSGAQR